MDRADGHMRDLQNSNGLSGLRSTTTRKGWRGGGGGEVGVCRESVPGGGVVRGGEGYFRAWQETFERLKM